MTVFLLGLTALSMAGMGSFRQSVSQARVEVHAPGAVAVAAIHTVARDGAAKSVYGMAGSGSMVCCACTEETPASLNRCGTASGLIRLTAAGPHAALPAPSPPEAPPRV